MKHHIPALFLCLGLAACVSNPKVPGAGAGRPETIIAVNKAATVIEKVTELCDRNGFMIEPQTANSVVCFREAPMGAQLFWGTTYGTPVQSKIRFNAFPVKGGIKLATNTWYETQNAFGKIDRADITNSNGLQLVHGIVDQAKAELER